MSMHGGAGPDTHLLNPPPGGLVTTSSVIPIGTFSVPTKAKTAKNPRNGMRKNWHARPTRTPLFLVKV